MIRDMLANLAAFFGGKKKAETTLPKPSLTDECWVAACDRCREKRRPCCRDHDLPCGRCRDSGKVCSYVLGCSSCFDEEAS